MDGIPLDEYVAMLNFLHEHWGFDLISAESANKIRDLWISLKIDNSEKGN